MELLSGSPLGWLAFNAFIAAMLVLDLAVFHKKLHEVRAWEAIAWTCVWIALALLFSWMIFIVRGKQAGFEFLTGYLIEKALSIDNIFVFLMIFSYFRIPAPYQHKILFWGIGGALVMRAAFIFSGIALIQRFGWMTYLFGALLIASGIRLARHKDTEIEPEKNFVLRLTRKLLPIRNDYRSPRFVVVEGGRRYATPLLVTLIFVEASDLMFAVDSVPAILAVSSDPFIVYTSNAFAILGLRSLYFAVAQFIRKFEYLHHGLALVLVFVGLKMLLAHVYKLPTGIALGGVVAIIAGSVLYSLRRSRANLRSRGLSKAA